jgi:hypothetical protein
VESEPPRKRSKRLKKMLAGGSAVTSSLPRDLLSVADFDKSEWEIMCPCFVES